MRWRDMVIAAKLASIFGIILLLVAFVGGFAFYGAGRIANGASSAIRSDELRAEILQREVDHLKWAQKVSEFVNNPTASELTVQTDPRQCAFGKWYYSDERKVVEDLSPDIKELLAKVEKPHSELHASAVAIAAARAKGDILTATTIHDGLTLQKLGEVQGTLQEIAKRATVMAKAHEDDFTAVASRTRWLVLLLSAAAVPFCAILGLMLAGSISRPAKKGVAFAEKLIDGDLTARLKMDRQDEIGRLGHALDRMAESLKGMISSMTDKMSTLATSTSQIRGVSAEMKTSTRASADKSASVVAAASQMSANMASAAAAVDQTSQNVRMVAAAAEELTATITEIAKRAADARRISEGAVVTAGRTSETVDELSTAAADIGKVTKTINDISEQTKLLALNATIEAARAGDAGKGFAVVAAEIKELARQVADATGDISRKVEAIRSVTLDTRQGIDSMAGVINDVNDTILTIASAVEQQSATVGDIARSAHEVGTAMSEASSMVAQTTQATSLVASDIAVLNSEAERLSVMAVELDSGSGGLIQVADEMSRYCGRFNIQ